ncbi:MAG: hypothetical protein Q4C61_05250 [Lachnospiraceae bacterium]|nr:hypothetical protein [Lachnospiraceae bacterium]
MNNAENNGNKNFMSAWILLVMLGDLLWLLLIALKITGVVHLHWFLVLTGCFWLTCLLLVLVMVLAAVHLIIFRIKRRYRQHKVDRRIIKQAKAAGAWTPKLAGGRALDFLAKEHGLSREPGETDSQLRSRIIKEGK